MTLTIKVKVPRDDVVAGVSAQYLDRAFGAIGFSRQNDLPLFKTRGHTAAEAEADHIPGVKDRGDGPQPGDLARAEIEAAAQRTANAPVRKRGEPSPGKARRTKAEIAEDEATEQAEAQSISTGESRAAPGDEPEDDSPEDQAQDAEDEAAESEANRKGLTHDDLRQAVGRYVKKFGMAAATTNIVGILGCKQVDVPDTQEALAEAIAKIDAATAAELPTEPAANAFDDAPEPEAPAEPTATKQDVINAMLDYAEKYDGQRTDQKKMTFTMEDAPKVFKMLFGDDCVSLSKVPADPVSYAKTVAGIREMIAKNPFKRKVK